MLFGWVSNYMVRSSLSPLLIPIIQEFNLTYTQAGLLATAFFYAYTFMQLPAGYLGDRLGRKIVLILCTSWWGLMSLLSGLAQSFVSLFLFRFLTGMGEGAYFSNDRAIISAYTPERKKGLGQGISYIGLGVGIFIGTSLAGEISDLWGWRSVFILFAFPSFFASFLIYYSIEQAHPQEFKRIREKKFSYSMVFKNRDLWLLYVGGIPGVYALWVLGTWAPAMFREIGVETLARSSIYSSILGVSGIPGVVLTGLVSDRLSRKGKGRKGLIAIEFFLMSLCMLLLGYGLKWKINIYVFVLLFFMTGFFIWGYYPALHALLSDIVPYKILGTAYGLTNTIHYFGSLMSPWATGWIKDATGSFLWGLYLSAILCFVGGVLILFVTPSFHCGKESPIFDRSPNNFKGHNFLN